MNRPFVTRIGDREYFFKVALFNDLGDFTYLTHSAIRRLEIIDTMFKVTALRGTAYINNEHNGLERSPVPYTFLGNGRDIFEIEIMPNITGNDSDYVDLELRKLFLMKYSCIVTEYKDVVHEGCHCKRIEFVDNIQYLLNEKTCTVNSAELTDHPNPEQLSNNSNRVKTGILIKAIIRNALLPESIDETNFDEGDKTLFLTSNGNTKCLDALKYVMKHHISAQTQDYCVISQDRIDRKFSLTSINNLFKNHEKNTIETLMIGGPTDGPTTGKIVWNTSPVSFAESYVLKHDVVAPDAEMNSKYLNNIIKSTVSKPYKTLILDAYAMNIQTIEAKFYDLYVKPFESLHKGIQIEPNFFVNQYKLLNKAIRVDVSEEAKNVAIASPHTNYLFYGPVHVFHLVGMTSREPFKLIDVIRADNIADVSSFDKNYIGRHLITSVVHNFVGDEYYNKIETVKPYIFSGAKTNNVS